MDFSTVFCVYYNLQKIAKLPSKNAPNCQFFFVKY